MRQSLAYAALFTVWLAAACSDAPTVSPQLMRTGSPVANSLSEDIDVMVADFFPNGLETATGARWSTVKEKLAAGDLAGAGKHLVDLSKFIGLKTGNIAAPAGETQQHAAARLVLAMSTYVYGDPTAPTPEPGPDIVFAVVPAGEPATVQTPSEHAAVDLEAGSTNEDRIIVISQEQRLFLEQCSGPLPTTLCQYPLFYKFESFPKLALNKVGRFAACMVTSGDRRPLEYTEGENTTEVDDRLRLAHNKPESEADYTPGSTIIEGIEILPKTEIQKGGLITCEGVVYPPVVVAARDGWLGLGERALYAVANFAGWLLTPKNLYAWDSGPEHDSRFFSNFNGVDRESSPDLSVTGLSAPSSAVVGTEVTVSYVIENRSRRNGGEATATASPTTVYAWLSSDQTIGAGDIPLGSALVPALVPDATPFPVSHTFNAPSSGNYYLIVSVDANTPLAEHSLANNTASAPITVTDPVLFQSGFEDGEAVVWTPSGLWNRNTLTSLSNTAYPTYVSTVGSALPTPFAGSRSGWYGQETTGNFIGTQIADDAPGSGGISTAANSGAMLSPSFAVPNVTGTVELRFKTWWEIEGVNPASFDLMQVIVLQSSGAQTVVKQLNPASDPASPLDRRALGYTSAGFNVAPEWRDVVLDLSAFKGQTIQLRFLFATGDVRYNGFRGWLIDDVVVRIVPSSLTVVNLTDGSTNTVVPADQATFPTRDP